jgi:ABC-type lipoprotein release transport system permease subunit
VNPLLRSALRHARRRPLGPLLVILGVALGVAVGIGIELANGAALRAMELSVERTAGRATHALSGAVQTPELWLARLRVELGQRAAAPVVEADVWLADRGGETLRLLGLDPWSEAPFRPYLAGAGTGAELDLGTFLTTPGAVLLGAPTAARLGLATGDRFELLVATTRRAVTLVGLLEPRDAFDRELLQGLLLCDVATAQELTGSEGFLSRIDLLLPAGEAGERRGAELLAAFGPGARLTPTAARVGTMERLTRSLRFNLQALSHLALVVGGFLVFSALSFAVVERREELGLLRTLGATRGQVALAIGIEGMLLVAAGTALGLGLGVVLGHGLVGLVLRTIDDLYFELEVSRALVSGGALGRGALLGLCTGAVAVAVPLLQALGLPPHRLRRRSDTEHGARRRQRLAARIGLVALLCGVAGGVAAERSMEWTALALLVGLLGAALLVPRAADLLLAAVEGPWARPLGGRAQLAARSARRSLSRTGVALSALTVALAASVGVAILVQSFRGTVEIWLARSLDGDVFLSGASVAGARTSGVVPAEWVERLRSTAGVAEVRLYRSATVQTDRGDLQVIGAQFGREHLARVRGRARPGDHRALGLPPAPLPRRHGALQHGPGTAGTARGRGDPRLRFRQRRGAARASGAAELVRGAGLQLGGVRRGARRRGRGTARPVARGAAAGRDGATALQSRAARGDPRGLRPHLRGDLGAARPDPRRRAGRPGLRLRGPGARRAPGAGHPAGPRCDAGSGTGSAGGAARVARPVRRPPGGAPGLRLGLRHGRGSARALLRLDPPGRRPQSGGGGRDRGLGGHRRGARRLRGRAARGAGAVAGGPAR